MSVREREAQIRKCALIGGWRNKQIGILPISGEVTRTGIGTAASGTLRLRHWLAGLSASSCRRRENTASSRRRQ
jgi:hypothetical protein